MYRVILDASARRFQAHRIYLRAAAARRWAINRDNLLRGGRPTPAHAPQLKAASNTLNEVGSFPLLPHLHETCSDRGVKTGTGASDRSACCCGSARG